MAYCSLLRRKLSGGKVGYYYRERDLVTNRWKTAKVCPDYVTNEKQAQAFICSHDAKLQKKHLSQDLGVDIVCEDEKLWTVQGLLDWDNQRPDIAESTRNVEKCMGSMIVDGLPPGCRVLELTASVLDDYVALRKKDGKKPRTINLHLQMLKAALNRALSAELISKLPVRIAKKKKTATEKNVRIFVPEPTAAPRSLTVEEIQAILAAVLKHDRELEPDKYTNPDSPAKRSAKQNLHDVLTMFAYTGLRKGELYGLRWKCVNLPDRQFRVTTHKRGSTGAPHEDILPMNEVVHEILSRRHAQCNPQPDELVFGIAASQRGVIRNGKKPVKRGAVAGVDCFDDYRVRDKLKRYARLAGIKRWKEIRVHDLRHSFVYSLTKKGVPLNVVQSLARHRDIVTTIGYAKAHQKDMADAVATLSFGATVVDILPQQSNGTSNTPVSHFSNTDEADTAQAL